jgi:4-amino-4-deoxy-L-arabinose transferase-like glycosyltransferase
MKKTTPPKIEKPYRILTFFEKYYFLFLIVFLAVVCFNCFYQLGQFPARDWDEARHGVSAYEMLKNHNFWVNTYSYQTDYYNVKPPLSFWGIMIGYKIFGFNLFGMRFYSALSFVLTALITAFFTLKRYGKLESVVVTLLLACSSPFYRYHFARHGDADSLFMLFVVVSILSAMLIKEHPKFLYLCGFAFSLAFLTKSWHSILIVAVVGVYFIASKLIFTLNWKQWLAFAASAFGPILIWIAVRYQYDGFQFFKSMVDLDLLNRVSQPVEGHSGGLFYYVQMMFVTSLTTGLFPLCIALYYGFLKVIDAQDIFSQMNQRFKKDLILYLIWFVMPLIAFSIPQTKIYWYSIPIFYSIVVLSGLLFAQTMRGSRKYRAFQIILCGLLVLIVVPSFSRTWSELQPAYEDTLQPFLASELTAKENIKGKNAYLVIDSPFTPQKWDQSYQLLGELYLDLKCKSGGVQDFLNNSKDSVLIISKNQYSQYSGKLKNFEVVEKNKEYLCLTAK